MVHYVLNKTTDEVYGHYDNRELAEEVQTKLNKDLPYGEFEAYVVMDEADYNYYTGKTAKTESIFSVYGVGKKSDTYPPMDDLILAKSPIEARKHFEEKHPAYKAVDAYQVG